MPRTPCNNRCWALLVVSSEEQSNTIAHQREWAKHTAATHGWQLEREFAGVSSGKDGPRKIVREMMTALRGTPSKPDWILMIRLDRLGREGIECQVVLSEIRKLGVRIWTREGGEELGDTAMQRLVSAVKLFTGEQENEVKRDKMNAVFRRRKANGQIVGNRVVYGFERTPTGHAKVAKAQAATVKEVFRLRIAGYALGEIGRRMKATAAPFRFADGTERAMRWNGEHVKEILSERRYIGPIVDEVTFRRAHRIDSLQERRPQRFAYPLSGAVRCYCGLGMVGSYGGGKYPVRRYQCHDKHRQVNANRLEAQFVEMLRNLIAHPELIERAKKRGRAGPSPALLERAHRETTAKLHTLDKARDRVWDLFAQGKVREDSVQPQLDRIAAKRAALTEQLNEIESQRAAVATETGRSADVAAQLKRAARIFSNAPTIEDQRAIARAAAERLGGLVVEEDGTLARRQVERRHLGRKPAVGIR